MRMLSSPANWARIPPAALPVDPEASAARSSRTTSRTPSRRRWKAVAAPRAPPPITTTSAVSADSAQELPERLPVAGCAAGPLDHVLLLDREVVLRRRLELDPRIQERVLPRVQVVEGGHQARARRVLARVLEGVDERPRDAEPVDDVPVALRKVPLQRGRVLVD